MDIGESYTLNPENAKGNGCGRKRGREWGYPSYSDKSRPKEQLFTKRAGRLYGGREAGRSAAETFRADPRLDTATVILELAVGEVLVSVSGSRRLSP